MIYEYIDNREVEELRNRVLALEDELDRARKDLLQCENDINIKSTEIKRLHAVIRELQRTAK